MDRHQALRAFVTVADSGSFVAAARRLGRSTSSVTTLVQGLEAALGARLLNRTTRRLGLTPTGQAYFERVSALLAELDDADALVRQESRQPRGRLRVNAPVLFGTLCVAPLLPAFQQRHLDLSVDLVCNDRRVDVVDEGYDVVVRLGALDDNTLIARRLASTRMLVCAAPAYLARHGTPAVPDDLARHTCLVYVYDSGDARDRWPYQPSEAVAATPTTTSGQGVVRVGGPLRSNHGQVLVQAAIAGQGLISQPSFVVAEALVQGTLVRVLAAFDFGALDVHAVYAHRRHLSAKTRVFIDELARAFAVPSWLPTEAID